MKPTIKTMERDLKVLFRKWESKIHFASCKDIKFVAGLHTPDKAKMFQWFYDKAIETEADFQQEYFKFLKKYAPK